MNGILEKAEQLGKAIGSSERLQGLTAARTAVQSDKALQADIKALNDLSRKLAAAGREGKPIEPEQKRQVRGLQQKITGARKMQDLARAEADFAELMNRVNQTIQNQFALPDEGD